MKSQAKTSSGIPKCDVKCCKFKSKQLFPSPKDPSQLMKWKVAVDINRSAFNVCEKHFNEQDLIIEKNLVDDAVPALYLFDDPIKVCNYDCCGICLDDAKYKAKMYEISDTVYEVFIEITGYKVL